MTATRTSVITFDRFNLDPLPATITAPGPTTVDFIYGDVVGGDAALASPDGDASYVRYYPTRYPFGGSEFSDTQAVITMRGTVSPPIPADATFPSPFTVNGAFQVRYEVAPPPYIVPQVMVIPVVSGAPTVLPTADGWMPPFESRSSPDPAFGTTWWDDQHNDASGTGPYRDGFGVYVGGFVQAVASGYFLLAANNGVALAWDQWLRISYLALSIDWQPTVTPALRLSQRDDGLGISGAPPRIGGRSRSVQGARVPRIGGANTYS